VRVTVANAVKKGLCFSSQTNRREATDDVSKARAARAVAMKAKTLQILWHGKVRPAPRTRAEDEELQRRRSSRTGVWPDGVDAAEYAVMHAARVRRSALWCRSQGGVRQTRG
jgi:hypothetical protein